MSNELNNLPSPTGRRAGDERAATPHGQLLVYRSEDGALKIDVRLHGETAWLTQAHMADLLQTTVPNVNMHLRNIFAEGELQPEATSFPSFVSFVSFVVRSTARDEPGP